MGRVRSCSPLVQGIRATGMKREVSKGPLQLKSNTAYLESWGLSPIQAAASEEALSFF